MTSHRITAIEMAKPSRQIAHRVITAVETEEAEGPHRWTVKKVLDAMNSAERFYSQGANGRQARVQRYQCTACATDHIRTHISDAAIHELTTLERRPAAT